MWELAITQGGRVLEPSWAAPAVKRNEYVAIEADERQQQQRDTVDDQSSTRDHLLDGGRMTERGGSHSRRDSHDEKSYCTWRAQKLGTAAPSNSGADNFLDARSATNVSPAK